MATQLGAPDDVKDTLPKRILITGGTGFIGGRLVEKLMLEHDVEVRVLLRNYSKASRVARFSVDMHLGELTDPDAIDQAVSGCDVVVHCAYNFAAHPDNLAATQLLADAVLRHGVRRLVHLSSFSVYEPLPDGPVDEDSPAEPCGWDYCDTKLTIEQALETAHEERGLPVVMLQPTVVYGPFGVWTRSPCRRLRHGRLLLPGGGAGICNCVYVDDVVDAILLAMTRDGVDGERFLVSGPDSVTWKEFMGAYEEELGLDSVVTMTPDEEAAVLAHRRRKSLIRQARETLRAVAVDTRAFQAYRAFRRYTVPTWRRLRARGRGGVPLDVPDEQQWALFSAKAEIDSAHAREKLGYAPRFDFERGMGLTRKFVNWARL